MTEFKLPQTHLFCYLQLKSYTQSIPIYIDWMLIQTEIKKIFGLDIPLNPYFMVLGLEISKQLQECS